MADKIAIKMFSSVLILNSAIYKQVQNKLTKCKYLYCTVHADKNNNAKKEIVLCMQRISYGGVLSSKIGSPESPDFSPGL